MKINKWIGIVILCSGYLAPEYILGGQLTMKADVYSFGVLILEIICGRSSAKGNWGDMPKYLLEWVCWFPFPIFDIYCCLNFFAISMRDLSNQAVELYLFSCNVLK